MSAAEWADRLRDHRGQRVVFLSHVIAHDLVEELDGRTSSAKLLSLVEWRR